MKKQDITIEQFANILKQNAIIEQAFQDIWWSEWCFNYSNAWVLYKEKLIKLWRNFFVNNQDDVFEIDSPTINKRIMLDRSGHTKTFFDYVVVNPKSWLKHRIDKLIEEQYPEVQVINQVKWYQDFIKENELIFKWDWANKVKDVKIEEEKLMFELQTKDLMRPETCQNIFVDWFNLAKNNWKISWNLPYAIAQIWKWYRKEISWAQNSLLRRKEFYMAELEWYCREEDSSMIFEKALSQCKEFYYKILGFSEKNLRFRDLPKEDLAHYSKRTIDVEYKFPWWWAEIQWLANRTNYDISNQHWRKDVHVIEPSFWIDRLMLAIIFEGLEIIKDEDWTNLFKFNYPANLQPYDLTILPVVDSSKYNLLDHYKQCKKLLWDKYNILFLDQNKWSMPKRMLNSDCIWAKLNIVLDQDVWEKIWSRVNDGTVQLRKIWASKKEQIKIEFDKKSLLNWIEEMLD